MKDTGTIQSLDPRGFGFINCADGTRRFFAAKEVIGVRFEQLAVGDEVRFLSKKHPFRGPRAGSVERV